MYIFVICVNLAIIFTFSIYLYFISVLVIMYLFNFFFYYNLLSIVIHNCIISVLLLGIVLLNLFSVSCQGNISNFQFFVFFCLILKFILF